MPLTLALKKGAKVIHLTYDGQSLHIEGDEMDKKASSSRSCLSFGQTSEKNGGITIDKLYLLHITHLHRTNMVQIRALVHRDSKNKNARLEPYKFLYSANEGDQDTAVQFCNQVMDDVYKGLQPEKRLKVLINPFGGQGLAKQTFESHVRPVFEAAGCQLSVQYTESQGHAVQIAKDLDIDAFDAIVTVSGDGVIHEVINGFLERPDAAQAIQSVPLGVIPGGTGNALSICLAGEQLGFNPAYTALQVVKGTRMPLDLCSVTYGHRRYFSFLSHNYGITSYADLATEHLRWMGDARTVLGLMQEIFARHTYPMEAAVQIVESDKEKIKKAYRASRTAATSDTPDHVDKHTHSTIPSLSEPVPSDWTIIKDDVAFFLTSKVPWLA
ncbi:ATP-NAD kinase-like domain-containing protein, partial [Radiomyces spectabilis]|uniref:ATP-NAD kinase-like domain-containing protein n=1 Tax=Radiomyces spectabilis TaxID=64574 RepID=UPI002220B20D